MRLIKGFLAGLVLVGILAMMPAAAFAHGGGGGEAVMVGEAAVTDLAGDFMVASPVTVLAGHSVWEGTQWVGGSTAVVEISTAGDFMAASPVTVLAGHSEWEGTQ